MELLLVVNKVGSTAGVGLTTYRLALEASRRGHTVWVTSAGGFELRADGSLLTRARRCPLLPGGDVVTLMTALAAPAARSVDVDTERVDMVLLRANPAVQTPWARAALLEWATLLAERGRLVLNDPLGLARAASKLSLHRLPAEVRPATLVTRSLRVARAFADEIGEVVLKPASGSGGRGVFLPRRSRTNFTAMFQSIVRDGYCVVQEFVPEADEGDTRLFLVDGMPLEWDGRLAAVRRVPSGDDRRSNVHVGACIRRARDPDRLRRVAESVRAAVQADGLYFVGLDIVGERVLEMNVFSPGGLGTVSRLEGVDFIPVLVDALESRASSAARGRAAQAT